MKTIKFIFSSLFSNATIINESNKKPWWLAIILAIVACLASVVPSFVNTMQVNGSDPITISQNYSIDYSLKTLSKEIFDQEGVEVKIENGKLTATGFENAVITHNEQITLLVEYVPYETTDTNYDSFTDKVSDVLKRLKTSYPIETEDGTKKSHLYSTLLLGSQAVYLYVYDNAATCTYTETDGIKTITEETSVVGQSYGDYSKIEGDLAYLSDYYKGEDTATSLDNALNQWCKFFDKAYSTPRNQMAFQLSGMYLGVDVVVLLISTLMIFLLSKGKNSIRRIGLLEGLKMVCFASVSPALLAILLGLMIPSLQTMGFMMFIVLRVTWLSMKATSPAQQAAPVRK